MSIAAEPRAVAIDLTSQAFKQDPFPTLARMRDLGPVIRVKLPIVGKVWMATTYEAVNELLRDHYRFGRDVTAAGNQRLQTLIRWMPGSIRPLATNMLSRDPPDHRRLRGLVEQAFRRRSVETLRPHLETLADEALDRLAAEAAARGNRGVDLIKHFTRPFPLAVICEMLGLPPEDRPHFTRWAMRLTAVSSFPGLIYGLITGARPLLNYVRAEIRRQSAAPRDGLIAALIEAEEAGEKLSEDELISMIFLLLAAGHETTLHQIAMSVLTLFDHPAERAELTSDWSLADSAVQELLRYVSFAQVSKPRIAREDTEFYGQLIRRGQLVIACLASANSDPAEFPEPTRLDLHRHPNRHVAFGAGIHVCLGAALARAETAIALERLFTRFPNLRLAVPREAIRFTPRFGARTLRELPVCW